MKQIKALIIRENFESNGNLVDSLSEWGVQTLEMNGYPDLTKIYTFSPHLIFIEIKLYKIYKSILAKFLNSLNTKVTSRIIILFDSHEKLPLTFELEHCDILSTPFTIATLFHAIHHALHICDLESSKKIFSKQLTHIHDELAKLFDQVLNLQQAFNPPVHQNIRPNQSDETLFQLKPLIKSLLKESKKTGPLHRYEIQLHLLSEYLNKLEGEYFSQHSKQETITDLLKLHSLSQHELKIVSMINSRMTSEEIAEQLFISLQTVKCHRRNIRKKLNLVGSKYSLVEYINELNKK